MEKPKDSSVLSANNHWLNSLPFKLSVIQFAVAIVIIATSMWLIFSIETKHHMETEQTLSQSKGQAIVALAQEDVAKIESLALAVGSIGETYQKRSIEIANLVPPMLDINHYHNLIVGGGVWPEPGAFNENKQQDSYFWTRSDDQQFVRVYSYNDDGERYQDEPWYKPTRFIPHGSAYWSPAYTDPHTKEIMVTASAPMWRDHEFIGVSTVDIRLEAINKFFNSADFTANAGGYVFVLDSLNQLLSYPLDTQPSGESNTTPAADAFLAQPFTSYAAAFPQMEPINEAIAVADSDFIKRSEQSPLYQAEQLDELFEGVSRSQRIKLAAIINANTNRSETTTKMISTFSIERDPMQGESALVTVFIMPKTHWKVVLVTPVSSLAAQANTVAIKIGAFLLLSQLAALFILFLSQHRLFVKPVAVMATSLDEGNTAQLELDANTRKDEIGKLARAFIARSHQLEVAYASLDASNLALEQQLVVQKQAQSELKVKETELSSLLNASQNLICIKDVDGSYNLVNDKFCEVIGIERDKLIGLRDIDIYPPHIAEIVAHHDSIVYGTDKPHCFEQPIPTAHGEQTFLVSKYPISNAEGMVTSIGAMAIDISQITNQRDEHTETISELKQQLNTLQTNQLALQQTIENGTKLQDELAKQLAHSQQLATINQQNQGLYPQFMDNALLALSNIQEQLFTHLNQPQSTEQNEQQFAMLLARQTDNLRHLRQLLGHATDGRAIRLSQFLLHFDAIMTPILAEKRIRLNVSAKNAKHVQLPPLTLLQIFFGLLQNSASRAFDPTNIPDNAEIELSVVVNDQCIAIDIRDNGVGLDKQQLEKLNQMLAQRAGSGTLYELAFWLNTEFDGQLHIDSEAHKYTAISCQLKLTHFS
ncbi:PAS domain S-box protein [Shewanella sp. Scap07]|uniref:PDC sensor domain-containing protein n=1 Tax=Shewanella sp. Scap07 TaxID=2589987 RepID=UPI0015B94F10|nr:PAS domain-containing protein [Shewanella sp. Scap07]QLE85240.1 PAS domain S-box protein [Shewanella sp. Scap07]